MWLGWMMVTGQSHHPPLALWHTRLRIFNCSLRVIRGGGEAGSGWVSAGSTALR